MILTTHALVGAAIGEKISNLWLIIALSLSIHFILDSFRHGEYVESFSNKTTFKNTWWKIALDFFLGAIIIFSFIYFKDITQEKIFNILLGSLTSMFPDLLTLLYWKFKLPILKKAYAFHTWVHRYPRNAPERIWNLRNSLNDILFSLAAIIILFIK